MEGKEAEAGALIPEEFSVELARLDQILVCSPMVEFVIKVVRPKKEVDALSAVLLLEMLFKTGAGQIVLEHMFQSTIHA